MRQRLPGTARQPLAASQFWQSATPADHSDTHRLIVASLQSAAACSIDRCYCTTGHALLS
ncbi:hypothetical protein XaplCFBP3123_06085 [Xanthomonas arboricola pv. populi]|nr:hypothetical protein XaplCFBP3123_06085 [Xanthomonas arboricola pv. populi]